MWPTRLRNIPRPKLKVCVLGDASHCDEANANGIPCMDVNALKKLNKDKKLVKKLGKIVKCFCVGYLTLTGAGDRLWALVIVVMPTSAYLQLSMIARIRTCKLTENSHVCGNLCYTQWHTPTPNTSIHCTHTQLRSTMPSLPQTVWSSRSPESWVQVSVRQGNSPLSLPTLRAWSTRWRRLEPPSDSKWRR